MTNIFWNSYISANVTVDRKVFLHFFCYFNHLTILCMRKWCIYALCAWCCSSFKSNFDVLLSIFYQKLKRKRERGKGLSMCVISKDQGWGVERGHIISSSKCSSAENTSAIYLPQQRENSCEERENISVWGERQGCLWCLEALLDDWSSAVVKNRLLQQLLHRLLSLACSIPPPISVCPLSLKHTHIHTQATACFQPIASPAASFPFSSLSPLFPFSSLNPRKHGKTDPISLCSSFHQPQQLLSPSFSVSLTRFPFLFHPLLMMYLFFI